MLKYVKNQKRLMNAWDKKAEVAERSSGAFLPTLTTAKALCIGTFDNDRHCRSSDIDVAGRGSLAYELARIVVVCVA